MEDGPEDLKVNRHVPQGTGRGLGIGRYGLGWAAVVRTGSPSRAYLLVKAKTGEADEDGLRRPGPDWSSDSIRVRRGCRFELGSRVVGVDPCPNNECDTRLCSQDLCKLRLFRSGPTRPPTHTVCVKGEYHKS